MINMKLVEKLGISQEAIEEIKHLQEIRQQYLEVVTEPRSEFQAKIILDTCHNIEYKLQELWGFNKSIEMHRFWEFPHCSCPKIDNEERYGTNAGYIYNHNCPLHKYRFDYINLPEASDQPELEEPMQRDDLDVMKILLQETSGDSSTILSNYIQHVLDQSRSVQQYYFDNWKQITVAPGSKLKHHAWEGGYVDHILQMLFLLEVQIQIGFIKQYDRKYLATTILLHDIEKAFRSDPTFDKYHTIYTLIKEDPTYEYMSPVDSQDNILFHSSDETAYRILHDIKHAHGELDSHNPIARVLTPSGAYLHAFDILSARVYFNMSYNKFITEFGSHRTLGYLNQPNQNEI